jgi:hypothetical protein
LIYVIVTVKIVIVNMTIGIVNKDKPHDSKDSTPATNRDIPHSTVAIHLQRLEASVGTA